METMNPMINEEPVAEVKGFLCDEIDAGQYAQRILAGQRFLTFAVLATHPLFYDRREDKPRELVGNYIELGMPDYEGRALITSVSDPQTVDGQLVRNLEVQHPVNASW